MTTNLSRRKLAASALAAVGAPALIFLGAGTANAGPAYSYNNDLFGPLVTIRDWQNVPPQGGGVEWCHYHSNVSGQPLAFPYDADFALDGITPYQLQIPGIETGTKWDVTISCPVGGVSKFVQQF